MASAETRKRELEVTHDLTIGEQDVAHLERSLVRFRQIDIWKWLRKIDSLSTKYIVRAEEIGLPGTVKLIAGTKIRDEEKVKGGAVLSTEVERELEGESEIQGEYAKLDPQGVIHKTRFVLRFSEFAELLDDEGTAFKKFNELINEVHIDILHYPFSKRTGFQLVRLEIEYNDNVSKTIADQESTRILFEHFLEYLKENEFLYAEASKGQKKLAKKAATDNGIIKTPADFKEWESARVAKAA